MKWKKLGLVFNTVNNHDWMVSHACVPTSLLIPGDRVRIYFAPRNKFGQSIPTFIEVSASNPKEVLYVHDKPILELGKLGTFDDGGIMPCSIVQDDERLLLYYVGWNPSVSVPYRNAIGVAESLDGGVTFNRLFDGPIVDRNILEPYFTASPCVLKDDDVWHMWYASSIGFVAGTTHPEPLYIIKYARSTDGINWQRDNVTCIHPKNEFEANARPTVIKEDGMYKMWFTYRGSFDYRDGKDSYRIGFAQSTDAINWERKDECAGIDVSEDGWDSTMITYPNVISFDSKKYFFYNGNGFGKTGIGVATK